MTVGVGIAPIASPPPYLHPTRAGHRRPGPPSAQDPQVGRRRRALKADPEPPLDSVVTAWPAHQPHPSCSRHDRRRICLLRRPPR
jgi:hypothetical protein